MTPEARAAAITEGLGRAEYRCVAPASLPDTVVLDRSSNRAVLNAAIAAAIREAVAEERERCARLAENAYRMCLGTYDGTGQWQADEKEIAKEIRARTTPAPEAPDHA